MGENHFKILKAEILEELDVLNNLTKELITFYDNNKNNIESLNNLRVLGSILHDFYTCIEKIFQRIAIKIDGEVPDGPSWHSTLLNQMNLEIPSVRKKVINTDLKNILYDYLRFRHIFRNVYGFVLNWDKMNHLVESVETVFKKFEIQILKFIDFLDKVSSK